MAVHPSPEDRQDRGVSSVLGQTAQRSFVSRHRRSSLVLGVLLLLLLVVGSASSSSLVIPTISISSVATDQSVTIQTHNYPPNQTFQVRMNYMGTLGLGGPVVGTLESGAGGSLTASYAIPDFLKGQRQIAIRLDSPQGYYSYNWFWNNTSGSGGQPPYTGIPLISVSAVVRDTNVTITTHNFPPNQIFDVTEGYMGTLGINGIKVGEINSGDGSSQSYTFPIPPELHGQQQISIRAQTRHTNPYFAYNWFWNNTTGGTGGNPTPTPTPPIEPPPVYGGTPVIKICTVVRDGNVTFETYNYPPNMDFHVTMSPMYSAYGTSVGSFNSGPGGTFRQTFNIPANLYGLDQISIRVQGSPHYSYNWFWNNSTTADHCTW